jgi:ubiquitin-like 1-activating enzyme E1 B
VKNLVLVGFGNIEIVCRGLAFHPEFRDSDSSLSSLRQIDLDTIDLSNLNRQFLFRKADIKKSKALVASAFAHQFNPGPGPSENSSVDGPGSTGGVAVDPGKGVNIKARHGNIKEPENDVEWMKGFDLVMSALDNMGTCDLCNILAHQADTQASFVDARRHVNRLCVSAGVPLIESGTQGYLGQVTPMQKVLERPLTARSTCG